jgi:hypothetical protein
VVLPPQHDVNKKGDGHNHRGSWNQYSQIEHHLTPYALIYTDLSNRGARGGVGRWQEDAQIARALESGRCGFISATRRPGGPHGASPVPIALPLAVAGYFHVRLRRWTGDGGRRPRERLRPPPSNKRP